MRYICSILLACALMSYDVPKGWFKAGSAPDAYEMGTDVGAGMKSKNAATIKSTKRKIKGFGTLMQNFSADKYRGKKIKLTGYMRSDDVESWAGLWLRVDGRTGQPALSFDNMYDRAIKGSVDWTKCEIVLDVPEEATNIAYGALLHGTGQIWFDGLAFEEVAAVTKATGKQAGNVLKEPQNMSFD